MCLLPHIHREVLPELRPLLAHWSLSPPGPWDPEAPCPCVSCSQEHFPALQPCTAGPRLVHTSGGVSLRDDTKPGCAATTKPGAGHGASWPHPFPAVSLSSIPPLLAPQRPFTFYSLFLYNVRTPLPIPLQASSSLSLLPSSPCLSPHLPCFSRLHLSARPLHLCNLPRLSFPRTCHSPCWIRCPLSTPQHQRSPQSSTHRCGSSLQPAALQREERRVRADS